MKKYFIVAACIIAMGFAQNMLDNPGFENWIDPYTPNDWQYDDTILIAQEDVIVHGGNFSAKDSLLDTCQTYADLWQGTYGIQGNIYYTCSFWILDNDPAGRVRAGFWWYPPPGYSWPNQYSEDSPDWQQWYVDTLFSPADAESVTIWIRAYDVLANWDGDAIFYIDDVFFGPTTTPQPPMINRFWHRPTNPDAGVTENIYAKASDTDGTINYDTLYYGINNLSSPTKISHTSVSNDTFRYQIPGQSSGDTVFYCLKFVDNDGLETISDTHAYYVGEIGIYINEVRYDDYSTDDECFVELYGPGSASLNGFTLVGVNGNGGYEYKIIDLSGYSIPGDGFFVIAQNTSVPNYDLVHDSVDYQNGPDNIELRYNNITIDAFGYGSLDGWVFTGEWTPAPDVTPDTLHGRYPDGYDTDNNLVDFHLYLSATPGEPNPAVNLPPGINRVWHTPINPGAVITEDVYAKASDIDGTIDADTLYYGVNNLLSPTKISHTLVSNDTFTYQIPGQSSGDTVFYYLKFVDDEGLTTISDTHAYYIGVVGIYINEIVYDVPGFPDEGAFVELYGPGSASLDGFSIVGVNGYDGEDYHVIDLTSQSIPADGFFVVAYGVSVPNYDLIDTCADYQNGPDNVELRLNNITVDALGYGELGTFVFTGEWMPALDAGPDSALGRYPDGNDTDNNYEDFNLYSPGTPGAPNPDVGIAENTTMLRTLPMVMTVVRSGITSASIIESETYYPITVYNVLGRQVEKIFAPKAKLNLATGIYFLRLNNVEKKSAKLIVVR